jgi:mannose-6-phosphate isomerase-like protein (cupin superfamily)
MRLGPNVLRCPDSGERIEILHRPSEPGQHVECLITLDCVGSGPAPHLHPAQVEQFRVVRGRVEVIVGDRTLTVGADEEITVPAATAHHFRALEAGSQLLVRISPGDGFEAALEAVYELFDHGQLALTGPRDPVAVAACFERHKHVMIGMRGRSAPTAMRRTPSSER